MNLLSWNRPTAGLDSFFFSFEPPPAGEKKKRRRWIVIEQPVTIVNIRFRSPSYFYMDRSIRAHTVMSRQEHKDWSRRRFNPGDPLTHYRGRECFNTRGILFYFILFFCGKEKKALSSPFVSFSFISKMYVSPSMFFLMVSKKKMSYLSWHKNLSIK